MTPDSPLAKLAASLDSPLKEWPRIDVRKSLRHAAKTIANARAAGILLTDGNKPIAQVTAWELLLALSQDIDSVTGLPRSGALRDWLSEHLRDGNEVAVVFLDLDSFGEVNRAYGHTEGDAALARAAEVISNQCSEQDFPARFGGDEFAVGSLRNRGDSEALAEAIRAELGEKNLPATFGVSGGRRSGARKDANIGSTVEELLRLASLDCMESKGFGRSHAND